MDSTSLRFDNALVVLPSTPRLSVRRADVLVDGDKICKICPPGTLSDVNATKVIDGTNLVLMSGLINGHVHSWDHYLKGTIENLPMELAMAFIRPRKAVHLTPDQVYLRTMIGAIEAVRSGATTIVDDMSLGQHLDREHVDAAIQAYSDVGIRALIGFSMVDKAIVDSYHFTDICFSESLKSELKNLPRPDGDALLDLVRSLAETNHPESSRVGVIVAPSAPHRCTDNFLVKCRDLSDDCNLPMMIHCQETRFQMVTCMEFYGKSLVSHLKEIGFLKPRTALIHSTWLSPEDISIIAETGASVQYNPWSNAVMGSGIAPVRECLDAGINLSIGTDGSGLLYGNHMVSTLGMGAVISKVRDPNFERWLTADEMLRAATEGGGQALGLPIGRFEEGAKADLIAFSLETTVYTPLNDVVRQCVYGERGESLRFVIVDGEIIFEDGVLVRVDESSILKKANKAHQTLVEEIHESQKDAEPFMEGLRDIYTRSLGCCISDHIHPATITSKVLTSNSKGQK